MVKLQSQNFSYAVRFKLLLCDISLKNTFSERCMFWSAWECRPVVLNRVCAPAQRGVNKFPWGCEPFGTLQMESLVIKFPNKYTCFSQHIWGQWGFKQGKFLKGGVVKKG